MTLSHAIISLCEVDLSVKSEARGLSILRFLWCFVGYNKRWMLDAEATTEGQGWAHFSASGRAGKWLAESVTYFQGYLP